MRRAARIDDNQRELVEFLRSLGASVWPTHTLGAGFPDILIGYRGKNFLAEIKDPNKSPSRRRLTRDESDFFNSWAGQVDLILTREDCLFLLGLADPEEL